QISGRCQVAGAVAGAQLGNAAVEHADAGDVHAGAERAADGIAAAEIDEVLVLVADLSLVDLAGRHRAPLSVGAAALLTLGPAGWWGGRGEGGHGTGSAGRGGGVGHGVGVASGGRIAGVGRRAAGADPPETERRVAAEREEGRIVVGRIDGLVAADRGAVAR